MSAELTNFVTVFRTDQRVHLDWASNALEEAGIPYQSRRETPATGTGTGGAVIVPESSVAQAREVLAALPFEQTTAPDTWSFQPKPGAMLGWKLYAVLVVSGTIAGVLVQLINALGISSFLLGVVALAVLAVAFFLLLAGQVESARCPCCSRLGRASHYGHCHCRACGAVFWLSGAGYPVRLVFAWRIVVGPLAAFVFGLVIFGFVCFQTKGVQYALLPALAVSSLAAVFKAYRVIRIKELVTSDHAV